MAHRHGRRSVAFLVLLLGLCACAAPDSLPRPPLSCAQALQVFERRARDQGLNPGAPRAVPGFPDLATDRALGAVDPATLEAAQVSAWLEHLRAAGRERRALLHGALALRAGEASKVPSRARLERCADRLFEARSWDAPQLRAVAAAARVEGEYSPVRRTLGLYPLTSVFARFGIRRLQEEVRAIFATPREALPRVGVLERFVPEDAGDTHDGAWPLIPEDTLGPRIDHLSDAARETLFARHAPVLEVDVAGAFDRPGTPYVAAPGQPHVEAEHPVAYRYATLMRFAGRFRLQLVYVFWFAERPPQGPLDTLDGALDGLVWRVTLGEDGAPLLYDSIHPCGCYHQFFPAAPVELRAGAEKLPEPPLVPQRAPVPEEGQRLILRVASGTHFLQRVYVREAKARAEDDAPYALRPYSELYSVAGPEGPVSLFDPDGRVAGTERAERFYLWPMGIPSPGAMRDRGRHATAFVGRRHFDDGDLLDRLFTREAVQP